MPKKSKTSRPITAFILGLLATLLVVGIYKTQLVERIELQSLDARFRSFSNAPQNDSILHVDIDDRSLSELGRWPWPRELLAGVVEALEQADAKMVALDIILPNPQEVRLVTAAVDIYSADPNELTGSGAVPIFDDAILADTIGKYSNVFVPMHININAQDEKTSKLNESMASLLKQQPNLPLEQLRKELLPDIPIESRTGETETLRKGYLYYMAMGSLSHFGLPLESIGNYPAGQGPATPPLVPFAKNCHGSGFVTVDPDLDGIVRRIPLIVRSGERAYPQFALSIAAEQLSSNSGGYTISADSQAVTLHFKDSSHRIPVDKDGNLLINWIIEPKGVEIRPAHISAAGVGHQLKEEKRLEKNRNLSRQICIEIAYAKRPDHDELIELFAAADALYSQRLAAQADRLRKLLFDPANAPPKPTKLLAEEERIEKQIGILCEKLIKDLDEVYLIQQPADDFEKQILAELTKRRNLLRQLKEENIKIAVNLEALQAELKEHVNGKVCIIGSVATGAADFVPTPMGKRTPGVLVHSNILNTITSSAFVRRAPRAVEIAVILLAGLIVSHLASRRPVMLQAGPAMILLIVAYILFNCLLVFNYWGYWLVLVAPLAAMLLSFLVVAAYRQLTEERAKRHIRGMFAHALSPTLVDRLIEDPSLARLGGERRQLSCFFSDIAGFTTLSERLGEHETVQFLNKYFDEMTEVIQSVHGGYLNKFLGDGIFAFFGAPVPQTDHSRRAIEAALDCQKSLEKLNDELAKQLPDIGRLSTRIGITTGSVMVGNCGSSKRMDYTAIGDTVNLSSRLDSANKFFKTQVLVTDQTLNEAGREDFFARPLGNIIVVGKNEPVSVWHVAGRAGEVDGRKTAFENFGKAIELFSNCRFGEAAELFDKVIEEIPADKPAKIYCDLCHQYISNPPGRNWQGALELTEK